MRVAISCDNNSAFSGTSSRLTRVIQYQKKHSLTHTLSLWLSVNFLHFLGP